MSLVAAVPPVHRRDADESVARHFSRLMNASCFSIGLLSDPPLVAVAAAVTIIAALLAARLLAEPPPTWLLWAIALSPLAVGKSDSAAAHSSR